MSRDRAPAIRRCAPPLCDLFGVRVPDRADRHGLGVDAGADRGHGERRRARHPRRRHDDVAETEAAIAPHQGAAPTAPFGVNLRADAPDVGERAELLVKHGVRVASFALAPNERGHPRAEGRRLVVVPVDRRQAARREGRGAGASTR